MKIQPRIQPRHVAVDDDTHERLRRAAFEERSTMKQIVERAVKKDLDERARRAGGQQ